MTTSSIASLTSSSKRDMCAPFWSGRRSQKHMISAWKSRSVPLWLMRIAFAERVTPALDRLIGAVGRVSWRSSATLRRVVLMRSRSRRVRPVPGGTGARPGRTGHAGYPVRAGL